MHQKKHLNAIAALEASKDAEPGSVWLADYCEAFGCSKCYANRDVMEPCCDVRSVEAVRADFQSGLDAYHKRKAEKDDRRATGCAHYFIHDECELCRKTRDEIAEDENPPSPAPLIPDPPDTPEVRRQMEAWAAWKKGDLSPCCKSGTDWFCEAVEYRRYFSERGREDVHAFALSWLSRHPAVWDAKNGPYPVLMRHKVDILPLVTIAKKDELYGSENSWRPATLSEVLPLIFDGPRQFADEARRQGWKR